MEVNITQLKITSVQSLYRQNTSTGTTMGSTIIYSHVYKAHSRYCLSNSVSSNNVSRLTSNLNQQVHEDLMYCNNILSLPAIMKPSSALITQAMFLTLLSTNATCMCPQTRDQGELCENKVDYFDSYREMNCTQHKVTDALEAQWRFMNSDEIGVSPSHTQLIL